MNENIYTYYNNNNSPIAGESGVSWGAVGGWYEQQGRSSVLIKAQPLLCASQTKHRGRWRRLRFAFNVAFQWNGLEWKASRPSRMNEEEVRAFCARRNLLRTQSRSDMNLHCISDFLFFPSPYTTQVGPDRDIYTYYSKNLNSKVSQVSGLHDFFTCRPSPLQAE